MPGTYVYGVVWADDVGAAGVGRPAVAGEPLRAVCAGPVAALASDVAADDPAATRGDLMTHADVLRQAADRVTVLPMRFGVVMPDDTAVAEDLLGARRERLESLLTGLRGRVELELRAGYVEESALLDVLLHDPRAQRLLTQTKRVSENAGYYDRIRLGELLAAGLADLRARHTEAILARLEPLAAAVRMGEPVRELDALDASFLVERDRVPAFDEAVTELGREFAGLLRFKYIGPLPAHSFVDLEGETPTWA